MERRTFIAGNWKMNGSLQTNANLVSKLVSELGQIETVDVVVAAPFVYLDQVNKLLLDSTIALAAQNVSEFERGAYTGEVSGGMLAEMSCAYVLVGHSERRQLFAESNEQVAHKFEAVQSGGLIPILCVGESLEERESGQTDEVVVKQLEAVIELLGVSALSRSILAYEPVWAIGTGKSATAQQAQDVHACLRNKIAALNPELAQQQRIVYGGSVNPDNAKELFGQADIDGGLVGGASLEAGKFIDICKAVL